MAKAFKPAVVTANDLIEGDSVFLGDCGWVRDIAMARVAMSAEDAAVLEQDGVAGETGNLVVGPYLINVSLDSGAPVPLLRREQIRASGLPTIPVGLEVQIERRAA